MVGTKYSGNPNIGEISKEKSTGPKTLGGKLKVSMNASKSLATSVEIKKALSEMGIAVDFKKAEDSLTILNSFKSWFISVSGEELTEIAHLDEIIKILKTDTAVRTMGKLNKGIPLGDSDLKLIKLLKETLEASHKLKFGDKHLHAHVGYDDIRQMMFDDNSRSKRN